MDWLGQAMVKHYRGDDRDVKLLVDAVASAFVELSVEDYQRSAAEFVAEADHPTLGRPYRECAFAPMVELLRYLESHGFTTLIASGRRPRLHATDRIRALRHPARARDRLEPDARLPGDGLIVKQGLDVFDDGPVKPVRIWSRIGRRPALACGNSNGDIPMLHFAGAGDVEPLRLLLRHDDGEREMAYDAGAEQALAAGFSVISMKNDWSTVFGE